MSKQECSGKAARLVTWALHKFNHVRSGGALLFRRTRFYSVRPRGMSSGRRRGALKEPLSMRALARSALAIRPRATPLVLAAWSLLALLMIARAGLYPA